MSCPPEAIQESLEKFVSWIFVDQTLIMVLDIMVDYNPLQIFQIIMILV